MAVEFPPRLPFPRRPPEHKAPPTGRRPAVGAPASAVDRLGLRFLDPATALSEGGQTISATVYVGDCLLVGGDPAQLADTASVIEEITGLTVTVEESGLAGIAREAGLSDSVAAFDPTGAVERQEG